MDPCRHFPMKSLNFCSNLHRQAQSRNNNRPAPIIDVTLKLQETFHSTNCYVRSFKYALKSALSLDFAIVIDTDKRSFGEQAQRFTVSECNEVPVVISGEQHETRAY